MLLLVLVSLLWAFSFGLTKGLTAGLDGTFVATARLFLALLVFLPFLRLKGVTLRTGAALTGIGAVQFGLMYLAYNESFRYLPAYQVALFTITTPILVTLLADALDRTFRSRALFAALLAMLGTAVVVFQSASLGGTLRGFLFVQLSNVAFAVGQIAYKRFRARQPALRDRSIFALLYAGAFVTALTVMLVKEDLSVTLSSTHLITLLYLGAIASGLGFFLWNKGAVQVNAGTLAVMNNAKVPLAVACSLLFFGESADLPRLAISLALLAAAVWLAERR
ncbi:MAG TPA: EamA family transporter [Lacunisphaera sp.]|nr:EamA family transporter [Lacunisphaera sp.]